MPTTFEPVRDMMKPAFDAVRIGRETWAETVRIWTELGQRAWPAFFSMPSDDQPDARWDIMDASFDFTRRVLDAQEAYARAILTRAEPTAAQKTKSQTTSRAANEKRPA